jgi:hypothetical protein
MLREYVMVTLSRCAGRSWSGAPETALQQALTRSPQRNELASVPLALRPSNTCCSPRAVFGPPPVAHSAYPCALPPPVCTRTPLLPPALPLLCALIGFATRGAGEAGATSRLCTLVCPCRSPRRWASAASLPARRRELQPDIRSKEGAGDRRRQTMSPLSPVWSEALPGVEALVVKPTRASIRVSMAGLQVRGLYPGSSPGCVSRCARVSGVGHSAGARACAAGGVENPGGAAG